MTAHQSTSELGSIQMVVDNAGSGYCPSNSNGQALLEEERINVVEFNNWHWVGTVSIKDRDSAD